jgi:exodeoxyribonuclease VII large subunit
MTDQAQGALFADDPTLGVGDVVGRLTRAVASAFPAEVWVRGEVEGLRPATAKGHTYLTLTERASRRGPAVTLEAVLLSADRRRVERSLAEYPGFRMADGIEVRVRGRVSYRFGRVRLLISDVDPVHTLGRMAADRDRIRRVLAAEGLLDANGRLPLPVVPLRVGLVTSAGSAACEDVLHELEASGFGFAVLLADARVQGADAEASMLRALHGLRRARPDLVLVVRGGGSRTDLVTFDSERVARAIAGYPVPVITGVGHEIDTAIADEVAHTACKTPTAAAALVVESVRTASGRAEQAWAAIARRADQDLTAADGRLLGTGELLGRRSQRVLGATDARLGRAAAQVDLRARVGLDRAAHRLDDAARRLSPDRLDQRLRRLDGRLTDATSRLGRQASRTTSAAGAAVDLLAARTAAVDPARALARGWSLTRTIDGRLVRRPADVAPGDRLVTVLAGGTVTSTVDEPVPDDTPHTPG